MQRKTLLNTRLTREHGIKVNFKSGGKLVELWAVFISCVQLTFKGPPTKKKHLEKNCSYLAN